MKEEKGKLAVGMTYLGASQCDKDQSLVFNFLGIFGHLGKQDDYILTPPSTGQDLFLYKSLI